MHLDLLPYKKYLKTTKRDEHTLIWDRYRKRWVKLTPEELVRQLFLLYLSYEKNYPNGKIAVEKQLLWNGRQMRYDALIYGQDDQALMLIECKAAHVGLGEDTLWQMMRYNISVQAPYQVITNGRDTFCFQIDYAAEQAHHLSTIPSYFSTNSIAE